MKSASAVKPSEIEINALHASALKAMSSFVQQPTIELAQTVVYLLNALARHPERFIAPCGHDVYVQASKMWTDLAAHMRTYCQAHQPAQLH